MGKKWDFKGWATRHDVTCGDGRIIKPGAFKDSDQKIVPLVWNHNHKDADNVLGHALLEYRDEGVYAYAKFNNTAQGGNAKELVRNGDITSLSIFANKLKQKKNEVLHGNIRELSLVLAGSNPGAYIETVLVHSDTNEVEEAIMWNNANIELIHGEGHEEDPDKGSKEDPKKELKHKDSEEDPENKSKEEKENMDKTIEDVWKTLNEEQQKMVYALIGASLEEQEEGEDKDMKHNAFEGINDENVLTHSEFTEILGDARRIGSLKEAFLEHGITDVENYLFPEAQSLNRQPELITRDQDWVAKVMAGVSKSPFSRVKSTAANITADEARAKGYTKGGKKIEEVITALKRITTPTTVYKLQKMDRDDIIDITDFDVVAFLKGEMRTMLNEELARAYLIGDGRSGGAADKINPLNIRPIYGDDSVYTVAKILTPTPGDSAGVKAKALIQEIVRSRKDYKGSGNPTFFTTEDVLVEMLLLEDLNGRVIYDSIEKLHTALRVKEIITVPVMEGVNRVDGSDQYDLLGILVNLTDYNVGADKGGQVSMFEDFDLNYNKHEYLIETRCSGALKKPYSAITFESKGAVVAG